MGDGAEWQGQGRSKTTTPANVGESGGEWGREGESGESGGEREACEDRGEEKAHLSD